MAERKAAPDTAGLNPQAADRLSFHAKSRLVNLLLDCVTMADRQRRDHVVSLLRPQIAWNTTRSDSAAVDAMGILSTCLNYTGGLAELLDVVSFWERGSDAWQRLELAAKELMGGL